MSIKTEWFHFLDFKFFDSLYMGINAQNGKFIVTSEKEVIYKNIHIFIERVWTYDVISKKTICKNLKLCFKGDVFNWHLVQLLKMEWKFLVFNDDNDSFAN